MTKKVQLEESGAFFVSADYNGSTLSLSIDDGKFEAEMPENLRGSESIVRDYLAYESAFTQRIVDSMNEEVGNEESAFQELLRDTKKHPNSYYVEASTDTWSGNVSVVSTIDGDGDVMTHALFKRELDIKFDDLVATLTDTMAEQASIDDDDDEEESDDE